MMGVFKRYHLGEEVLILFNNNYEHALVQDLYDNRIVVLLKDKMNGDSNLYVCEYKDVLPITAEGNKE